MHEPAVAGFFLHAAGHGVHLVAAERLWWRGQGPAAAGQGLAGPLGHEAMADKISSEVRHSIRRHFGRSRLLLTAVVFAARDVPTRRAAKVDPTVAPG
jgi:hypothetical protein